MTESHTPPRTHTDTTPLDLRLEAPSRTRSGVHVPLRLVLSNPTPRPITIDLGGMPTAFDFVVHTVDGVEIWRRLEGTNIRDVLAPRTVEPGGSIRYTAIWPQRDDEGRPVRPGLYRVVGILPLDGVPGGRVTGGHTLEIATDFDASRPGPPISMAETRDSGALRPDSRRRRTFLLHSAGSFVFQRHNVPKITLDIPLIGRYCR
jgi:hypothetical protein